MEDFPGNSFAEKQNVPKEIEPEKNPETGEAEPSKKIVNGKLAKRTLTERFKDLFAGESISFVDHLAKNVVEPMVKDIILTIITQSADGVRQGIEQKLFGQVSSRGTRTTSYGTGTRVNYSAYSSTTSGARRPTPTTYNRTNRPVHRTSNRVQTVIVETRGEGQMVLDDLEAKIAEEGYCSLGDYYDLVGITPKSTDFDWGWTSLDSARVTRDPDDEYRMRMPDPFWLNER